GRKQGVGAWWMGGQACILSGAAEFSRGVNLAVQPDEKTLERLRRALAKMHAEAFYYPPLSKEVLEKGHACHFRVDVPRARGLRVDVMSRMHGCDAFHALWERRRQLKLPGLGSVSLLSLPDLVRAKQTQRDQDRLMIRRLVEADYHSRPARPSRRQITFWLREGRTPVLLLEMCRKYPKTAHRMAKARPALQWALRQNAAAVEKALLAEERALRA